MYTYHKTMFMYMYYSNYMRRSKFTWSSPPLQSPLCWERTSSVCVLSSWQGPPDQRCCWRLRGRERRAGKKREGRGCSEVVMGWYSTQAHDTHVHVHVHVHVLVCMNADTCDKHVIVFSTHTGVHVLCSCVYVQVWVVQVWVMYMYGSCTNVMQHVTQCTLRLPLHHAVNQESRGQSRLHREYTSNHTPDWSTTRHDYHPFTFLAHHVLQWTMNAVANNCLIVLDCHRVSISTVCWLSFAGNNFSYSQQTKHASECGSQKRNKQVRTSILNSLPVK